MRNASKVMRRSLLAAVLSLSAMTFAVTASQAAAPAQRQEQVPGYYRYELGKFEVTAIYDGNADLDFQLIQGASSSAIGARLRYSTTSVSACWTA